MRRFGRIGFIFLAIYLVFIGGSAYYTLLFPVRVLHHILLTVLLALWLFGRLRRGQSLPVTPLNLPLLAVVAVWLVSVLASADVRMSFENLWFQLVHVLIFFVLVDMIQHGRQRLLLETQFMLGAAVIFLSGLELASWYFGLGILPGTQLGWASVAGAPLVLPRLSLAMNISTLLAGYLVPLIILTGGWALTVRRRDYQAVLGILAGLLLIILLLTGSRGGMIGIVAGTGAFIALRLSQSGRLTARLSGRVIIGTAMFAGVVLVALFLIWSVSDSGTRDFGDAGRVDMWRSAIAMTSDHPLTGVGATLFGRAFRDYRDPALVQDKLVSAHNVYLNTAAENGLPGILVSLWLGLTFVGAWWHLRQAAGGGYQLRLDTTFAGLAGMGIHSLVDVFTITPIVLLMLLLVAYSITRPGSRLDNPPQTPRWITVMALLVVLGYGVWLIQLDRAQSVYQNSLSNTETALTDAIEAAQLDPALNLYTLQIAYLTGQDALTSSNPDIETAIAAYETALEREPTWDTGWINLAVLALQQGNATHALEYLDTARQINYFNTANLYWAVLAETNHAAPDDEIIAAYQSAITRRANRFLPLADFWRATPLRQAALEAYIADDLPLDLQYRVLSTFDAERATALVSAAPQTAAEWWVAGEYTLTVENDPAAAIQYFSQAIALRPTYGDYYVSRARAELHTDPASAWQDLDIATLLTTADEYPNAVRADLANIPEDIFMYRANALPPRQVRQEFAATLYGRTAQFDVYPGMRPVGPGRVAMQPWYAVAEERLASGDREGAITAYRAILDYAPDEQEAREALAALTGP
ncbi:MAG: O-antigen ligase family protein [Anaerolineaceae bacterium]|nr:O-antigen ligase family protein [Anaerolineaceae bacterium]